MYVTCQFESSNKGVKYNCNSIPQINKLQIELIHNGKTFYNIENRKKNDPPVFHIEIIPFELICPHILVLKEYKENY